jgi:hypothetical protein
MKAVVALKEYFCTGFSFHGCHSFQCHTLEQTVSNNHEVLWGLAIAGQVCHKVHQKFAMEARWDGQGSEEPTPSITPYRGSPAHIAVAHEPMNYQILQRPEEAPAKDSQSIVSTRVSSDMGVMGPQH